MTREQRELNKIVAHHSWHINVRGHAQCTFCHSTTGTCPNCGTHTSQGTCPECGTGTDRTGGLVHRENCIVPTARRLLEAES